MKNLISLLLLLMIGNIYSSLLANEHLVKFKLAVPTERVVKEIVGDDSLMSLSKERENTIAEMDSIQLLLDGAEDQLQLLKREVKLLNKRIEYLRKLLEEQGNKEQSPKNAYESAIRRKGVKLQID